MPSSEVLILTVHLPAFQGWPGWASAYSSPLPLLTFQGAISCLFTCPPLPTWQQSFPLPVFQAASCRCPPQRLLLEIVLFLLDEPSGQVSSFSFLSCSRGRNRNKLGEGSKLLLVLLLASLLHIHGYKRPSTPILSWSFSFLFLFSYESSTTLPRPVLLLLARFLVQSSLPPLGLSSNFVACSPSSLVVSLLSSHFFHPNSGLTSCRHALPFPSLPSAASRLRSDDPLDLRRLPGLRSPHQ